MCRYAFVTDQFGESERYVSYQGFKNGNITRGLMNSLFRYVDFLLFFFKCPGLIAHSIMYAHANKKNKSHEICQFSTHSHFTIRPYLKSTWITIWWWFNSNFIPLCIELKPTLTDQTKSLSNCTLVALRAKLI